MGRPSSQYSISLEALTIFLSAKKKAIISTRVVIPYTRGDCRRCARVAIKNLIIDGNRASLGRIREPGQEDPSSSSSIPSSSSSQSSEELEDDGGDGDELDLEKREASARRQHEGELNPGSGLDPSTESGHETTKEHQDKQVVEEVLDDGTEISGSTSPLVLLGNNEGQVVSKCVIKDPR